MAKKNTDTVPIMVTPGEFVIKKKSAKKIGYDKLNKMNKTGKIVSKNKKNKEKKMPKKKKNYQFGGVVEPRLPLKTPGGSRLDEDVELVSPRRARAIEGMMDQDIGGGMMGYKKGGKVKATGGYKVIGQRKGYKVGK